MVSQATAQEKMLLIGKEVPVMGLYLGLLIPSEWGRKTYNEWS